MPSFISMNSYLYVYSVAIGVMINDGILIPFPTALETCLDSKSNRLRKSFRNVVCSATNNECRIIRITFLLRPFLSLEGS